MILIGSRALMFRAPELLNRKPGDYDFISTENEALEWLDKYQINKFEQLSGKIIVREIDSPIEFELIETRPSSQLLNEIVQNDSRTLITDFGLIPNFNLLFTLKASHRYLKNSPYVFKTLIDYHKMKAAGAKILPEYQEFFKMREKETYNYAHPKLNVKKDDFFTGDGISYEFNHDDLHLAMKHLDRPAYEYYKKDGEEVACSKVKFFDCDEQVRLFGVLEEVYTLALERSQIPFGGKLTPKQSFMLALSKVITSITSGWFREYAYENAFTVMKMYDDTYVDRFWKEVEKGNVKKI